MNKEEKQKKKGFCKSKLFLFAILPMFIVLVSALTYYALFSVTFNVSPAVVLSGDLEQPLGNVLSGDIIEGNPITITNNALSLREVVVTDDSPLEIETKYVSELTLSQKVVDFNLNVWELVVGGNTAIVKYTVVGDVFIAEVVSGELPEYSLVYYKDNSDRFNSPAQAIGIDLISGNLPYLDDANAEEYNYCETEEYKTCNGAKIWYVPNTAIDSEGNVDWSQASNFLFETSLVQFNSEGNIVVYPESSLVLTPVYSVGDFAEGEYTITTTIA